MNEVLITGATGLLGRHAAAALEGRGFRVHGLARKGAEHAVDLFDSDAVRACLEAVRPSHLLHLAWITAPGRYWNAPENLEWQSASLDLVRAFHAAGGRRAVIAGSCAEYDWETLPDAPIDEGFPCRPASLYGAAKNALRIAVAALVVWLHVSGAIVGYARYRHLPPPGWLDAASPIVFAATGLTAGGLMALLLLGWVRPACRGLVR